MSIRAVYDCMLFLQAASNPKRVHTTFRLVESGDVELFVSAEVLAEVRDVLSRPRHKEKFPALTDEHVSRFLAAIASQSKLVDVVPSIYMVDRDPKDSKYVNLALAASAEYLVSWDQHLLGLMNDFPVELPPSPSDVLRDQDGFTWFNVAGPAPLCKLQHIQSSFPRFAFVYIGRQLVQSFCKLTLGQPRFFSPATKLLAKTAVRGPMD